eukprot:jgi/Bigna1/62886/fgenesh1_kg.43_\
MTETLSFECLEYVISNENPSLAVLKPGSSQDGDSGKMKEQTLSERMVEEAG